MTRDETEMLDFLLAADFTAAHGYSYVQLLGFLKRYKHFYAQLYDNYYYMVRQERVRVDALAKLEARIADLEEIILRKNKQITNLQGELTRNLTWRERFSGKLKL